jgi:hypothetical protein
MTGARESLTILVDNDANSATERAARDTEQRWCRTGGEVRIFIREKLNDFNDAFMANSSP